MTRWLGAVALVLSIINMGWVLISRSGREVSGKLKQYRDDLVNHDRRIQTLEVERQHLVTKDDLHEVVLSISEMNGRLGKFEESLESVARTVRRIDDYLRAEARKA